MKAAQLATMFFALLVLSVSMTAASFAVAQSDLATSDARSNGSVSDFDYKLGPGDKLRVIVFNEPTLSGEFYVSSNGTISFPLVGEVSAAGMDLQAFKDELQKKLGAGYLIDPRVSVEVLTYRPFYILGEVVKPGEYPYTSGLSVLKAVATAGGFTYRAQTKKVFIRHLNQTSEQAVSLTTDASVQPGDTIRVGERFF